MAASLVILLQDPYLILSNDQVNPSTNSIPRSSSISTTPPPISPSNNTLPSTSSASSSSTFTSIYQNPFQAQVEGTTLLKGTVVLTLSKPLRVSSLAITLNGSSHLALSPISIRRAGASAGSTAASKRIAHYSRQHLRTQQFLIEPSPDPDRFTTLVATGSTTDADLKPNQIAYPFTIQVPNNMPVSVTTPHGGTIYRLTAELTMAKTKSSSTGLMALLSAAKGASSVVSVVNTVQIYRAGFLRSPCLSPRATHSDIAAASENQGLSLDGHITQRVAQSSITQTNTQPNEPVVDEGFDNAVVPDSILHVWPGFMEATVSIPLVHLPAQSKPDLRVKVKLLRSGSDVSVVKCFQAALWERVIFRLAKTTVDTTGTATEKITRMAIVGIEDRIVSAQRTDEEWTTTTVATTSTPAVIEKSAQFATPSTIRGPKELCSSRICNASTYSRISKQEREQVQQHLENPFADSTDVEFGAIEIEVQHFLRCSIVLSGVGSGAGSKAMERQLGDIPVVIKGLPSGPECDGTGLPTYVGSFATSLLSLEDAQTYEASARASMSSNDVDGDFEIMTGEPAVVNRELGRRHNHARDSVLSLESRTGASSLHEDYENDDAFMAMMGFRGSVTPPRYEDSVGRPSVDASVSELQVR